ncbi:hypothetical protein, partial [Neobacillus jeddahensis]|uniref:hypothetical protein n=1 Tax=Neobacillus jeddahensis TaxID=1461580 RepID=UPI00058FD591
MKLSSGDQVKLTKLNEWQTDLLTEFPDSETYWFGKIPKDYELHDQSPKELLIQNIIKEINGNPDEVYLVEVNSNRYYTCSSEEYILKATHGIFLLSLQVHD